MSKLSLTVLRNSAFGFAAQMIIKVLSFTFSVLVVRRLGPEVFGQYTTVLAFCTTLSFIGDLGLSPYLVREVARLRIAPDGLEKAKALYSNVIALRILLSLLSAVIVILAAWLTGRPWVMVGAIVLNSISLVLYGVHGTADAMLTGFERIDISSVIKIVYQIIFVGLGFGVLILQLGYYGLIAVNIIGVGVMALIAWQSTRKLGLSLSKPSPDAWLPLLRASLPFGILALALGLSYKFDSILLNVTRGDAETGYYGAAYNLVFSAVLISNIINVALYPSLSRHSVTNPENLVGIYERMLRYLILISLPIAMGVWIISEKLIHFLYDSGYNPSIIALQILIWVAPLMFLSEFLGYIVVLDNQERLVARSVLISSVVNVAANLIFIPWFGYIAACIMTVLTEMILVTQYIFILRKKLAGVNLKNSILRPILAVSLMGAVLLILSPWLPLLAMIITGGVAYILFALLVGAISKEDLTLLKTLRAEAKPASV
jgi:O-antigen/teichoic acid export membrane protein